MVSVERISGQHHFNDMIAPPRPTRPSTANTMVLVLRPPSEDFKQLAQLTGSEMERIAHRKNRVIQMKLSAYLAEVCQQQRSSERLLKTEEYRFMQEVTRRSNIPRSVDMLQQLQAFTKRKFPDASYSYIDEASTTSRATSAVNPRPAPPMSARGPTRAGQGGRQLLDRPRTSAVLLRARRVSEEVEEIEAPVVDPPTMVSESTDLLGISTLAPNHRPVTSGQTTELPDIHLNNPKCTDESEARMMPPLKRSEGEPVIRKKSSIVPTERCNSSNSVFGRKRQDSLRRSKTESKFNVPELPAHDEKEGVAEEAVFVDSVDNDVKMQSLTETDFHLLASNEIPEVTLEDIKQTNNSVVVQEDAIDLHINDDAQLGIIDLDKDEASFLEPITVRKPPGTFAKKTTKPISRKTNFNRIRTQPVLPLRHNLTSVLRQERTQYEANQSKIKDYLHKMTSRDFMTRASRDVNSAHSRRSSNARK